MIIIIISKSEKRKKNTHDIRDTLLISYIYIYVMFLRTHHHIRQANDD